MWVCALDGRTCFLKCRLLPFFYIYIYILPHRETEEVRGPSFINDWHSLCGGGGVIVLISISYDGGHWGGVGSTAGETNPTARGRNLPNVLPK